MSRIDDIRDAVIDDLTFDPDVDASGITVEYTDGEVVLTGSVPSYPDYVEAAAVARRVDGVRCVRNHLQIALPPGDYRDDPALTAMANDALTLGLPRWPGSRRRQRTATYSSPERCARARSGPRQK